MYICRLYSMYMREGYDLGSLQSKPPLGNYCIIMF